MRRVLCTLVGIGLVLFGSALFASPFAPPLSPNGHPPLHEDPAGATPGVPAEYPEDGESPESGTVVETDPDTGLPLTPVGSVQNPVGAVCRRAVFSSPVVPAETEETDLGIAAGAGTGTPPHYGNTPDAQNAANTWARDPNNQAAIGMAINQKCPALCMTVSPAYCERLGASCVRVWKTIQVPCWFGQPKLVISLVPQGQPGYATWKYVCHYTQDPNSQKKIFYLECQ